MNPDNQPTQPDVEQQQIPQDVLTNRPIHVMVSLVILLIIITGCIYFVISSEKKTKVTPPKQNSTLRQPTTEPNLNITWEKKYIDLYGIELDLPKGWTLTEINRRRVEMGLSMHGHDCANYVIKDENSYLELILFPICDYGEGFSMAWPEDAVIVKPKDSDGSYLVRYYNESESKYFYAVGYDQGKGDYETPPGLVQKTISNPPMFSIKKDQNAYTFYNSLTFTGSKDQVDTYLAASDRIITSLKVINNTITIQPTPTSITNNWPQKTENSFGLSFRYPPDMILEEETVDGSEPYKILHLRKKGSPSGFDGQNISISTRKDWKTAGFEPWSEPTLSKNNFIVGSNHTSIPAWLYSPPTKEEKTLEHYQTWLYFGGKNNVVYYLCQHEWDMDFLSMCLYQILPTMQVF